MTLGSLFDGIGGFPLAAIRNGIKPLWACEIEPVPISITKRHFPDMEHLGDVKKINGAEIEPVDIITFGSPCQDLSNAGLRAGLEGSRSGLFFNAIRIIKQMREKTNGKYPTRIIWENVAGAFSSSEGKDFLIVLKEIASIAEPGVFISEPPHKLEEPIGWLRAGTIVGNQYSLAWRVLDAQYWGVPQRRERIFLVADFGNECIAEIFFKPDSLSGNNQESEKTRKRTTSDIEGGIRTAGFNGWRSVTGEIEYEEERAPCIQANMPPDVVIGVDGFNQNLTGDKSQTLRGGRSDGDNIGIVLVNDNQQYAVDFGRVADRIQMNADKAVTLQAEGGGAGAKTGLYCLPVAVHQNQQGEVRAGKVANTLSTNANASGRNAPLVACIGNGQANSLELSEKVGSLNCMNDQQAILCSSAYTPSSFGNYRDGVGTIKANGGDIGGGSETLITTGFAVRRLTPLECERLQGFPDGWTEYGLNLKKRRKETLEVMLLQKISDNARYKALGNSVAMPCVEFLMKRIKEFAEGKQG